MGVSEVLHYVIKKWESHLFNSIRVRRRFVTSVHTAGYWNDIANQRLFMNNLAKKLQITDAKEWYHVSTTMLKHHGASGLLQQFNGSPSKMLKSIYPEYPTDDTGGFLVHVHMGQQPICQNALETRVRSTWALARHSESTCLYG